MMNVQQCLSELPRADMARTTAILQVACDRIQMIKTSVHRNGRIENAPRLYDEYKRWLAVLRTVNVRRNALCIVNGLSLIGM